MSEIKHKVLAPFSFNISATGSRVICNPAPTNTDEDFVVLANPAWAAFDVMDHMDVHGFVCDSDGEAYDSMLDYDEDGGFMSFKKGDLNYIITANADLYRNFVLATEVAKMKNLLKKEDRVALFKKMLYGE